MNQKPGTRNRKPSDRGIYRRLVHGRLQFSRVTVQETDLGIYGASDLAAPARELVLEQRGHLEGYIRRHGDFARSLIPLAQDDFAPPLVREMLRAGELARVGPMAAVAGAMAQQVGRGLLEHVDEVIVENGGDLFIQSANPLTIAIFAGQSPLSLQIGLKTAPALDSMAVCTSSGSVGHSLSLGRADAVCVVGPSCPLADAAATAIGNRVRRASDMSAAIQWGRGIPGVDGILVIMGAETAMWGSIELTRLSAKG